MAGSSGTDSSPLLSPTRSPWENRCGWGEGEERERESGGSEGGAHGKTGTRPGGGGGERAGRVAESGRGRVRWLWPNRCNCLMSDIGTRQSIDSNVLLVVSEVSLFHHMFVCLLSIEICDNMAYSIGKCVI